METTDRDNILINMDHDSTINKVINTEGTAPEEKQEVQTTRGRPKNTGQDETRKEPQKAREPKANTIKLDDEQKQLLNLQTKLNQFKEAEREYKEALKQFKPKAKEKATPKRKTKKEGQEKEQ